MTYVHPETKLVDDNSRVYAGVTKLPGRRLAAWVNEQHERFRQEEEAKKARAIKKAMQKATDSQTSSEVMFWECSRKEFAEKYGWDSLAEKIQQYNEENVEQYIEF